MKCFSERSFLTWSHRQTWTERDYASMRIRVNKDEPSFFIKHDCQTGGTAVSPSAGWLVKLTQSKSMCTS